ncbi:TonB-dependent receptor [Pontixanthobacter aestiaquae]|uniref:TonB-dependent receptor n=1 Tax=Pontixanthobacter aestiaquae TaxID=1509367 RepID=A0A844Z7P3_9SPHN|nr:TonB-dependent receptor [Pontixanthobacter aestiaquae]MDN3646085.1 TonB-dependent receptor [Pontixanthobacter aestiaquae]MXO82923.1 TonB-dependent receptor [Pontixanthobacter aestiaquae]
MKKLTSFKFGTAPLALGLALAASPVLAQTQPEEEADTATEGDVIVVTGSRIASPTATSSAPLQIVDAQAISDSGITNVQELLLENPAFGTPALSRTNSAFLTSGTGVATVDLRDLGSDRTLVLINGRRVVAGLPGSAVVDLNMIPTQFLEQVDVLTGGASSLYGSDAVAGVVNFVYKRDFEGIVANGQYGVTERGDDPRYQANLTVGTNSADGRGNIMMHFGYSNEEGLLSRERANTFTDDFDAFRVALFDGSLDPGDLALFGTESAPFFSSGPPQGRFDVNGTSSSADDFTFDAAGNLIPNFSTNGPNGDGVGANGFNRQFFRTLAVPVERYLFATAGSYEISDNVNVFFEGTYAKTTSSREIEPFFLSSGDIFVSGGRVPLEDANGNVNPIVPADIVAASQDIDGDGRRDYGFIRRIVEFGPRQGSTARDTFRFVVGLDGTVFDDRFRWDVSYNYGTTTENQRSSGQINTVNARFALDAIQDVNDLDGDGSTTDAICSDANARLQGCVPFNVFGVGAIDAQQLAYLNAETSFQTDITQQVVQGNISGSLFELPAGPVGIAAGVEYRKESSVEDLDALTNAGLNAGNAIGDTQGQFDVLEGYLEVKVPILADTPFFELLEIGGSVRVADYSTVGQVVSYSATGVWQPIDDLRIRGTYSRAVRAPNIGELFSAQSQTFPSGLTDPCGGIGATGGGTVGEVCRRDAGVQANIAANGVFTLTQPDIQGISGFNGGNPNLFEETADSFTVGAVFTPRSLGVRNLTITGDYYDIEISDVIAAPGRAFTLDQCFNFDNQNFCNLITRRQVGDSQNSAGSIEFINAFQNNGAVLKTRGLDVTASYRTSLDSLGLTDAALSARIAYNHIFQYDFQNSITAPADPQEGEIGTADHTFTANLAYDQGPVRVSFTGTFIGASTEDDQFCSNFGLDAGCFKQGAEFYLDTQINWSVSDTMSVYIGADNLLDNDAPNLLGGTTFNVTGSDTAADVYDIFGRRYYAGVRLRF